MTIIQEEKSNYSINMKRDILCLMLAYPQYITGVESKDQKVYIIMKSGNRIIYDDQNIKRNEEKISNADLQDMMNYVYPIQDIKELMPKNNESGLFRVHTFYNEIYGETRNQIESNLVHVKIKNKRFSFNKNNNAANSLKNVINELIPLAQNRKDINRFVFPVSGTYSYRVVEGTNLLSSHASGTSIDLVCSEKDYWRWVSRKDGQTRLDIYPREIVRIFEKNNFIWGGKWGDFDMMHYEYRPELLLKSRYFSTEPKQGTPWHNGLPYSDSTVNGYIKLIDEACYNIK
ncbi:MAG: hypothetical protein A2Y18_01300 [Clostridiales bacterium GWD2_32_19]|nr:MAG: hypothetical protein A2Y18_01300 [Clostridiales bacterium GWD2_32_19]